MQYTSTRDKNLSVTASYAIANGISAEGGLFVPENLPKVDGRWMKELCEKGGAVFFSTHVLDVAEKLCNKVAVIKNGALVVAGDIGTLTAGDSLENVFLEILESGA